MATIESGLPKGSVASMVNRLSKSDLAHKLPISSKPIFPMKPAPSEHPCLSFVASFPYAAAQPDELDLAVGEVVEFIEDVEDGWAKGRRKRDGKEGLFPTNFVEESKTTATTPTSKPAHPSLNTSVSVVQPAATVTTTTAAKRLSAGLDSSEPQAIKRTPSQTGGRDGGKSDDIQEMARVLFTYNAEHDDELSLPKVGAMVRIVDKNPGDPGWFLGELSGKRGLFPDNFVEVVKIPVSSSASPALKPPARPPAGFVGTVPSVPLAPPTVPAKPPKNVLSNSSSNVNVAPSPMMSSPAPAKPVSKANGGGGVNELKNRLMSQGLFSRGAPAPGENPVLTRLPNHNVEPPGPVLEESAESAFDPTSASQLVHINKSRPKQPTGRRPMSLFAGKAARGSQENLLEGEDQMTRSTIFAAAGVKDSPSPSRETTFPVHTPQPISAPTSNAPPPSEPTPSPPVLSLKSEEKPKDVFLRREEEIKEKEREKAEHKAAIVPPAKSSLSTSMHSLSGLSASQQSLGSAHSGSASAPTAGHGHAHSIKAVIQSATPAVAGGSGDANRDHSQWVPRSEFDALQSRVASLEARLAALERRH